MSDLTYIGERAEMEIAARHMWYRLVTRRGSQIQHTDSDRAWRLS
jgi:hypothetical protein